MIPIGLELRIHFGKFVVDYFVGLYVVVYLAE